MSKAQICPVCLGSGRYHNKVCHGCGGKGWVEVSEPSLNIEKFKPCMKVDL